MKKTNPRKIPKNQADVDKAFQRGLDFGQRTATVIFLTVLWDKEHADAEAMQRVGREINDLARQVEAGAVTVADLETVLREEYGIENV